MEFIKESIKDLLTWSQNRKYAKKLQDKQISYDKWIRQQEEKDEVVSSILKENKRNLTNDCQNLPFGGDGIKNEGNHSSEAETVKKGRKGGISVISFENFWKNWKEVLKKNNAEFIILTIYEGEVSEFARTLIERTFSQNKNIILIYGDEDVQMQGERKEPWFKPDWSPDRFLSSFYFGGLVAVRRKKFKQAWKECRKEDSREPEKDCWGEEIDYREPEEDRRGIDEDNWVVICRNEERLRRKRQKLYKVLYKMICDHEGFSIRRQGELLPVFHIRQVLFHSTKPGFAQISDLRLPESIRRSHSTSHPTKDDLISIVIPSKDNPIVLFACIYSIVMETRTDYSYEIVVVDNGSDENNRRRIEYDLDLFSRRRNNKTRFHYLYQPMEFNFSRMCNIGAQEARGNFLLFLNDDIEVLQEDWLDLMMEKAALPYAGAVGAKLLYPESDKIQHAGITNLRVGPAHKLQFLKDDKVYYYGMNLGVHNMLAVTGACLLVRREAFLQAGGFCEELAVAFNDVDLCYTLYEMGYYNIVRNDVIFSHHESLSRGKDGESEKKLLRLQREKDLLYERHQALYGKDPFYHPYLTTDMLESDYSPAYRYQVTLDMPWSEVKPFRKFLSGAREDSCLVIGMECAMDIYKWKYGVDASKRTSDQEKNAQDEDMGYYFQGYTFVIGSNNACFSKKLLLKNKESGVIFKISVDERYRKDIKDNLMGQLNVDLTGFVAKVRKNELPNGKYQFGMLALDKCSRTKLINWSNWTLDVKN